MPSNLIILQLSVVVLFMLTFATTSSIPQANAMISETSQSYDDEQNQAADHQHPDSLSSTSKHLSSTSDEDFDNDYPPVYQYKTNHWLHFMDKRAGNGYGENRVLSIPYRFGKRGAMPYRFGKRAGMHFRLGKKSSSF